MQALDALRDELTERFTSKRYDSVLRPVIEEIRSLPPRSREYHVSVGQFSGIVRTIRSDIRIDIGKAVIEELSITPTMHVADAVIYAATAPTPKQLADDPKLTPGVGVSVMTSALHSHFAHEGRTAETKFKHDADEKLASARGQIVIAEARELHAWALHHIERAVDYARRR